MKFIIVNLLLCATLISMVSAFKKGEVVQVKESNKFQGGHVLMTKKKAEAAGLIAGTATGILKKKTKSPKVIYKPYKIEEPKMKIKYITIVKPVLVRVDQPKQSETLYVRHEVKTKKEKGFKFLPSFVKGYVKGKFLGKALSKKL